MQATKKFNLAIVGATGTVGSAILSILEERRFPVDHIYALASKRSAGAIVYSGSKPITVTELDHFDFSKTHIALFSAGAAISKIHAPRATAQGCLVIDNTSQFRNDDEVPLVVPEVNEHALALFNHKRIIANPNCSTIQMMVALKPIYDAVGIERINVVTYQSVSGTGRKAIAELSEQSQAILEKKFVKPQVYPQQIAFNVLPHIDIFQSNGYTKEEMKMVWETIKILGDPHILVNPTTVRVPVFYGHSEAVHIETRRKITASEARRLLSNAPGVTVIDDPSQLSYPTAVTHAAGKDAVFVGRIREDISHPRGLNLWIVADNIRKGAALNAIQIAEIMIKKYL